MKYTIPDYYRKFRCIASDCPATCCAGWQIIIDPKTLKKYRKVRGGFGNRLKNSIDWESGAFRQYHRRCAFLNEENLCDIYLEAGPEMFCRTCRNFPRHVEEFQNEREVSLSLSCPVVARMLLARHAPVRFLTAEDKRYEREDPDFDFFLYSALQDARAEMFRILQNRERPTEFRMAKALALAHDIQNRIDSGRIFEIEALLERYGAADADRKLEQKFDAYRAAGTKSGNLARAELLSLLEELEVLDPAWTGRWKSCRERIIQNGCVRKAVESALDRDVTEVYGDVETEQLMVYFLFTYFCGAVYDGDALSKVKMAVVSTLILRSLEKGCAADLEERAKLAWAFSRELEHSDLNLNRMEELMRERRETTFEQLLECLCQYH